MHFATLTTLFAAAAVLGAPTEPQPEPASGIASLTSEVFDQGDGFYLASLNETGGMDVQFTPMAELDTRDPVEHLAVRDMHSLSKRDTVCSGRRSPAVGTLDEANRQLATNAAAQGYYGQGQWGWVHLNAETSYFCNYQANGLTYKLIIDMHTVVSARCQQSGYGYDRRTNGGGANDLSVGRTFRGDKFCDNYTHG